jgi:hypothetical protein
MSKGILLSSLVPGISAAPRLRDAHAFLAVCALYVFIYLASGVVLPSVSAAYAKWQLDSRSPRGDDARKAIQEMRRFRQYVGSTLNSLLCCSIAAFMVTAGFFVAPSDVAYASTRLACWFLSGYFVADLFIGLPDAREFPSDVVHHVLGLALVSSFLVADAALQYAIAPYGFWFFISESSTIPLNGIYMLEKTGTAPTSSSIYVFQRLFLLLFVICRVVLMPAFAGVHLSFFSDVPFSAGFLFAAISCWSLSFLQFYFFHVVIRKIREETEKVCPASLVAAVCHLLSPRRVATHVSHFPITCGLDCASKSPPFSPSNTRLGLRQRMGSPKR